MHEMSNNEPLHELCERVMNLGNHKCITVYDTYIPMGNTGGLMCDP